MCYVGVLKSPFEWCFHRMLDFYRQRSLCIAYFLISFEPGLEKFVFPNACMVWALFPACETGDKLRFPSVSSSGAKLSPVEGNEYRGEIVGFIRYLGRKVALHAPSATGRGRKGYAHSANLIFLTLECVRFDFAHCSVPCIKLHFTHWKQCIKSNFTHTSRKLSIFAPLRLNVHNSRIRTDLDISTALHA